jgi:hypothetical protein
MVLVAGGVHKRKRNVVGKMQIYCTACRKQHTFKCLDSEATELYLQLVNNTSGVRRRNLMHGITPAEVIR